MDLGVEKTPQMSWHFFSVVPVGSHPGKVQYEEWRRLGIVGVWDEYIKGGFRLKDIDLKPVSLPVLSFCFIFKRMWLGYFRLSLPMWWGLIILSR